ncbi:phosphatidylglycerophosphatase A family protein [Roseospirillum parvum]|uniref:Phosphatidylglycerophosphatase A n=1 Tax=Roseospirillum parvum TaxID=83401 RepID=A0A1G7YFY2_9PROT|nr:phosphatidylglycerophosphatase A [Roseospirillum parvum]SDG95256.1 phosphatidylglycerophosphatase A [Roseospirillum parvum]
MPAPAKPSAAAHLLAIWFGCGLSPKAPGTVGSLAALPLAALLAWLGGPWLLAGATLVVAGVGWWASAEEARSSGDADPSRVVIDEVAGQWLTLIALPLDPLAYLIGFAAFRLFDITKPWPVGWADRRLKGGLGIMVDDLLAGCYAAALSGLVLWALS